MATKTQNEGPEGRKNRPSGHDRPLTSAAGLLAPLADTDTPANEHRLGNSLSRSGQVAAGWK